MQKLLFTKWTVVISIFIIFGTILYITNVKNNNKKATVETVDTKIFKTKLQPKINELTTNYNDIIEKDWLPAWEEINTNGDSVDRNKLLVTMNAVSRQYETIMNEIDMLKIEENITDINIQKQLIEFTTQFKSASNFMKNAANLIIDGDINSTPNSATIENTKHALGLADQHIVIALSTLTEVEEKLALAKK
ncbi:hypothetical protein PDJ82_01180 [Bacillus cereus group sp. TH43LC]|uniref:hypothetical protein n=1 Tax=Bacillus cereus group TaxID=86661 RepID=UPI0011A7DA2F|nr:MULTISPECIES: hypothetical protein [Bacillus cereus group]MBE7144050.1 hypothetical protein [Bacillus paranthracis]MDA1500211.1 hypothetical protein [Bacillus cereus group sp. TH43LC]MDA1787177.1 hypothetical protein [Bacillus cereus group sp. BY5-1LC]MDA1863049.1 hypothetical protein [Bacillus cereus group sp. BY128LC]MEC3523710.1 hypothetical protein [Bacillus paranthracis]